MNIFQLFLNLKMPDLLGSDIHRLEDKVNLMSQQISEMASEISRLRRAIEDTKVSKVTEVDREMEQLSSRFFVIRRSLHKHYRSLNTIRVYRQNGLTVLRHFQQTGGVFKDPQLLDPLMIRLASKELTDRDCSLIKLAMEAHAKKFPVTNPLFDSMGNETPEFEKIRTDLNLLYVIEYIEKPSEPYYQWKLRILSYDPKDEDRLIQELKKHQIQARHCYDPFQDGDWYFRINTAVDC